MGGIMSPIKVCMFVGRMNTSAISGGKTITFFHFIDLTSSLQTKLDQYEIAGDF